MLRAGRMTTAQQRGWDEGFPRFGLDIGAGAIDWDSTFAGAGHRVVEIGFGMGDSLLTMAQAQPDSQFVGVEVHRPGVGKLLAGLLAQHVSNVRVYAEDAVEVFERALTSASLDAVHIYFPDPWHKKRHHKRRLIQPALVALLASRLRPNGVLHLATDWQPYAEHMAEVLAAEPLLENTVAQGPYAPRPAYRPLTKFEQRGQRLGHGVWDLLYRRRAP